MKKKLYNLKSEIWVYPGNGGWRFVYLDRKVSEEIKISFSSVSKEWGSIPVEAKIGKTVWKTSIFPDKKSGEYLLPVKSSVRKAEYVNDNDHLRFQIKILV